MNLNIASSNFEDNSSLNGGAIYFDKIVNDKEQDHIIEISDTKFINNKAEYFGGGIYSDFVGMKSSKLNNVEFSTNHAYAGGAVYTERNKENTLFNVVDKENVIFINNISESHGDDYASGPSLINLMTEVDKITITSGQLYPLRFNIVDEYSQLIYDYSKYYSNIIINAEYNSENENIDDDDDSYNNENKIIGNICNFSKGILTLYFIFKFYYYYYFN